MPLFLPDRYPARAIERAGVSCMSAAQAERFEGPRARVGIINLMPAAEAYEPMLLAPLGSSDVLVEPVWLRLQSHSYASSDLSHLDHFYRAASQVLPARALDGLILTGAPVEELAFADVRYWRELRELLLFARHQVTSTLGICWGAMALAKLLEIEKQPFEQKLFGIYPLHARRPDHPLSLASSSVFECAQSRHSGTKDSILEQAEHARLVRLLAHSPEAGYSIFESQDARWLMHLGHPEYPPERLRHEYLRDRDLGRTDVLPPRAIDLDHPLPTAPLPHGLHFLTSWLHQIARWPNASP